MKSICSGIFLLFILIPTNAFTSEFYQEGWTYPVLGKMKLNCINGLMMSELLYPVGLSENAEGNIIITKTKKEKELEKKIEKAFNFCNCVWDNLSSNMSFSNFERNYRSTDNIEKIMDKYHSSGVCDSPYLTVEESLEYE